MFKVMASNIWGTCPNNRPISNRDDLLASFYKDVLPDIIGIEECSPKARAEANNIIDLCADEYFELDPSPKDKTNFTPILYKKDIRVVSSGWHLFYGMNDVESKSMTYGVFERDGEQFAVINVHYYYLQNEAGNEARVGDSRQVLCVCDAFTSAGIPVAVIGDFNCKEDTEPIRVLTDAGLVRVGKTGSTPTHHAYPILSEENGTYSGGSLGSDKDITAETIDFIFTRGLKAENFRVYDDARVLDATDHCPIYAELGVLYV